MALNEKIRLLDLFSGTGGFHKGLSDAGFDLSETYFSEIDKHAIANYKYNFPDAKYIGSVENILQSGIAKPNIITFGSPCQDFSLAGKRAGMAGDRSSLIQKAIAAITYFQPDIFIWENVKGTFSSNAGADFWGIIQAFANIGGYRFEWQLVNTSWVLPQNRERIYLVGHLATSFPNWRSVFPIRETDIVHNKGELSESDKNTQDLAKTLNANDNKSWMGNFVQINNSKINVATKLSSSQDGIVVHDDGLCPTISVGHGNTPKIIVKSADKQGYEVAEEGDSINLQFPNSNTQRGRVGKKVAQTLDCNCNQGVIQPIVIGSMQKNAAIRTDGICTTLTSAMGIVGGQIPMVKQLNPSTESNGKQPFQHNRIYDAKGISPALNTDARPPMVKSVIQLNPNKEWKGSVRQNERVYSPDGIMACIQAGRTSEKAKILDKTSIRRLTEIECERLQGYPDNWTQFGNYDGIIKDVPKTQRYKLLGNAVTSTMVEFIGKRILKNYS